MTAFWLVMEVGGEILEWASFLSLGLIVTPSQWLLAVAMSLQSTKKNGRDERALHLNCSLLHEYNMYKKSKVFNWQERNGLTWEPTHGASLPGSYPLRKMDRCFVFQISLHQKYFYIKNYKNTILGANFSPNILLYSKQCTLH